MAWPIEETYKNLKEQFAKATADEIIDLLLDSYQRMDETLKPLGEKSDLMLFMLLTEGMQLGMSHGRHLNEQEKKVSDFVAALFTGVHKNAIIQKAESECVNVDDLFITKLVKVLPALSKSFTVYLFCCIYIDGAVTPKDEEYLTQLAPHLSSTWAENQ